MKYQFFTPLIIALLTLAACNNGETTTPASEEDSADARQFYQLKTYTFASEDQVAATDAYLNDAFIPALKRQGIGPVGVFKNRPDEKDSTLKTYVLIPFDDLGDFAAYEAKLENDAQYQQAGSAYLETPREQPAYQRIGSAVMMAFTDMPEMQASGLTGPRIERVYELRSYESTSESFYRKKVDMFNAGGEIKLFDRLNFNAVFYAEVLSGPSMPNLMYMTTFPDMTVRDSLWKEFFASPEWTELKAMEKYKNTVSKADIFLLYPTEYSDY